jgi:hypothetical protein
MVKLGTQKNPAEKAKRFSTWTQKALDEKGLWRNDFDDLTGDDVEKWFEREKNNDDG